RRQAMILKGDALRKWITSLEQASDGQPGEWDRFHKTCESHPVTLVFPLGELIRPSGDALLGTIWAWEKLGLLQLPTWDSASNAPLGLVADGIEGLVKVEINFIDALLAAQEMLVGRCVIECQPLEIEGNKS
ncbi:hypothetical protein KC887_08475, partial [Candidatus Kaiserbacteria bacterium]|nr:hypothetical protein [Candidatus Kaiserbacteria bacterium]